MVFKCIRNCPIGDSLGQAFNDGGLANAWLSNHHRVVFQPPAEDLNDLSDFAVAPKDRVNRPGTRFFRDVGCVGFKVLQPSFFIKRLNFTRRC